MLPLHQPRGASLPVLLGLKGQVALSVAQPVVKKSFLDLLLLLHVDKVSVLVLRRRLPHLVFVDFEELAVQNAVPLRLRCLVLLMEGSHSRRCLLRHEGRRGRRHG